VLAGVDAITFTSGMTVKYFLKYFSKRQIKVMFQRALPVSIGPMTTSALLEHGLEPVLQAKKSTVKAMVEALCRL
jgi:uroporphyrinogen-III synthase